MLSFATLILAVVTQSAQVASDDPWRTFTTSAGVELRYALLLPPDFDGTQAHPLVIALPPGAQDAAMVERGLELYWRGEAATRGFVVASPASPDGLPFFRGDSGVLIEWIDRLERELRVDGKPCLAGVSNGGLAAFALALDHPDRFACLLGLPGMPPQAEDDARLARLKDLPIAMFAGGADERWRNGMEELRRRLLALGAQEVSLRVFEGEGHVPPSLTGAMVFDALSRLRAPRIERQVGAILDDFHAAAAQADGARYFAHFAAGAVFLGTDASERWSVDEFRAYAEPYFARGQGWTYVPVERHVTVAAGAATAWFDERLRHAKYGEVRGSGVLVAEAESWKIAQYNLAFPVPNDCVEAFLKVVAAPGEDARSK